MKLMELYAEQAEQLAQLREAEARRLEREAQAPRSFPSPHKAIHAAADLSNKLTREIEIRKSLRADLLGFYQSFEASLAEALDVAAKFSPSAEELNETICAVINGETSKPYTVLSALKGLRFYEGVSICAEAEEEKGERGGEAAGGELSSISHEELLEPSREMKAQLCERERELQK
ncbi:MAG: hypothetical protein SGPRY_008291 [Prymnesium sp.]